jgi:hypothetical protein
LEDKTTPLLPKPRIAERVGSSEAEDTQSKERVAVTSWMHVVDIEKAIETDSVVA